MQNINSEAYFSELPKVDIKRSVFNMPFNHKTSFNVGQLIPFYCLEVVPGDTHQIRTSIVARLQTLLTPMMDDLELETFYFFTPNRIVDDHWKNIMGENDDGPWIQDKVNYSVPYLEWPEEQKTTPGGESYKQLGFESGTLADYFGIPLLMSGENVRDFPMVYPFRAYAKIVSEFFRDQNWQQPVVCHTDSVIRKGSNGSNWITDLELGGKPFVVNRYHDYFSSCLPAPQKSEDISIFGDRITNPTFAPVYSVSSNTYRSPKVDFQLAPLNGYFSSGLVNSDPNRITFASTVSEQSQNLLATKDSPSSSTGFYPLNLAANIAIPQATITQLRLAFQLQKYYEKAARGGTRYREFLREFFGVSNGDARMQIPEYLGGHRVPLSIHQVANTSQSTDADLGDLGAMSNTSDVHDDFRMSFTEHGFIIGLMCVRFKNTYGQGLNRFWSRRDALDFYNPVFAHISEQPVYKREIYGYDLSPTVDEVWGYNEAWADYRYIPNRVSGEMRPEVANSLASWHLADDYQEAPTMSSEWLQVNKNTVDRVLAVGSSVANQCFADIAVLDKATRPMPVHSIPGFADHF